jgi:signal transduction histidine kinase
MKNKKLRKEATEHKPAEQERLQRERLQGVLEMAGAVCHEFSQPMQAIFGYCGLLMMNISKDSALYAHLKKIEQQVDRMQELTNKLSGITKYETREYIQGLRIIDIDKASRISWNKASS